MKQTQENRITMFKTVADFLDNNTSVWSGMAPFATAVTNFKGAISQIDTVAGKQETPISGSADEKADARDTLEDVLFLMCEALGVIAHDSDDADLRALVAVTPSSLHSLGDEALATRAGSVLQKANTKTQDLAALDVTAANIQELTQALQTFNSVKQKPRTAVAERAAQTGSLPEAIRSASELLRNKIDKMVNLFRRSNPDFVAGYRAARVIIERGVRHEKKPAAAVPASTTNK